MSEQHGQVIELRAGATVDAVWREIANDLAHALRPYSCFREQRVRDGRIVVETAVPGSTLSVASRALDRYAEQVAIESYQRDGLALDRRATAPEKRAA